MADEALTVQLTPACLQQLAELAQATSRDPREIAAEAIEAYVASEREWIERVNEGIRQADAGEFATEEEVARVLGRFR